MLRVSTRGEYGVRLMVDLARHYGGKPRSLSEIGEAEGLNTPKVQYLEQLVRCLREHGLVESTRGAHGGYRLSRPPEQMRMSEIVRALEGQIAPMICATEGEMEVVCDRLDGCSTKYLWAHVRDAIVSALDAMTLADLLRETEETGPRISLPPGSTPVRFVQSLPRRRSQPTITTTTTTTARAVQRES